MQEEEIERFSKLFTRIDYQMVGYVSFDSCKEYFAHCFADQAEFERFFEAMDIDGNGRVYWNEFLSAIINHSIFLKEENLREAFTFLDRDGKGFFTAQDFKIAIGDQHLSFGGAHANFGNVIQEAFPGKEFITLIEFMAFMKQPIGEGYVE